MELPDYPNEAKCILWADVDNDGDQDLFITYRLAANKLYINQGDLIMTDVSAECGIDQTMRRSYGACFGDYDNDGLLDTEEDALGTDPTNPDSDGDGFCDGPSDVYAADGTLVCRGPDPEPLDSAFPVDTDGDMFPDEDPDGPGGLEADTDDDGDGFSDELENNCGSDPLDANNAPADLDGDTICDMLDADIDGDGLNNTVETNTGIYISSEDSGSDPLNPDTDGDGYCDGPVSPNYSDCIAGPDAFPTDASAHLDTDGDGDPDTITGNSTTGLVEDLDDDGDGVSDKADFCDPDSADVFQLDWRSNPENDADADGCRDRDEDAQMLADKAAEERQQRMLMLGIGSVVLIIAVVAIIVSGRTKGQEINISGTTEGKIQIVGGVANNLFDHSKNEQTTSTVSSPPTTVGQVDSQVEDSAGQEE